MFSWRTGRRLLIGCAAFITLICIVYLVENIHGKRTWEKFRAKMIAAGEPLDPKELLPDPVPDDQNFAMTPLLDYEYHEREAEDRSSLGSAIWEMQEAVWKDPEAKKRLDDIYGIGKPASATLSDRHKRLLTDLVGWQTHVRTDTNFHLASRVSSQEINTNSAAQDVLIALSIYDPDMNELHEAAKRPHAQFPIHEEEGFSCLLSHLQVLRKFSRISQLKAAALLAEDRSEDALKEVLLIMRFTESFRDEPILISGLVHNAMIQLIGGLVWEGNVRGKWTPAQLATIEERLRPIGFIRDFRKHVRGERAIALTTLWRYQNTPGVLAAADHTFNLPTIILNLGPSGWFYQNLAHLGRMYDEFLLAPVDFENGVVDIAGMDRTEERFIDEHRMEFHPYKVLANVMFPAIAKAARKYAQGQCEVDQIRLVCAIEQYRAKQGNPPTALSELKPQFLPDIPHDPVTGDDYIYRTEGDDYVIYSLGSNGTDDGGEIVWQGKSTKRLNREEGDWVWNSTVAKE